MADSATRALSAGTRVGDYEVVGLLGAGGMGTVYEGVHPVIGKRVAIKVLHATLAADPRMVDRFTREARAVVRIGHRYIIDVFTFGEAEGVGHYFIMPLLAGESLGDRVDRLGPLALEETVRIVGQIASALDAAHAAGIFHRDLKPDNVFMADEDDGPPSVRVLDFGIAKLIGDDVSTTQTGAQMGTPLFMSPEQWAGADVDARTDVYALGVLTHHLLTGRFPFESDSVMALMGLHARGLPTLPSNHGADPRADAVVETALAKERDGRFDGAGAFARALAEAASASLPAPAPRGATVERDPPGRTAAAVATAADDEPLAGRPGPARWLVAAALAIAVIATGWYALRGGEEPASAEAPAELDEPTKPSGRPGPASPASSGQPTGVLPAKPIAPTIPGAPATSPEPEATPAGAAASQKTGAVASDAPPAEAKTGRSDRRRPYKAPRSGARGAAAGRDARRDDTPRDGTRRDDASRDDDTAAEAPPPARREPATDPPTPPKKKDRDKWGDTVDPFSSQ